MGTWYASTFITRQPFFAVSWTVLSRQNISRGDAFSERERGAFGVYGNGKEIAITRLTRGHIESKVNRTSLIEGLPPVVPLAVFNFPTKANLAWRCEINICDNIIARNEHYSFAD